MDIDQGIKIYTPRNGIRCAVCHDPATIALEASSDVEEWVQTIELCDTHSEILLVVFRVEMLRRERDADEPD